MDGKTIRERSCCFTKKAADENQEAREAAIRALANGWHDDPGTLPLVRERAEHDEDKMVREAAIRALANGWLDDPEIIELLRDHSDYTDRSPNRA